MVWRFPLAWLGLLALALPLLAHLLSRRRAPVLAFPSLRFLSPRPLAAVRARRLSDTGLLALRSTIVVAAVAALADPVVVTPWRVVAWNSRVARAIVVDVPGGPDAALSAEPIATMVESLRAEAFASTVVTGPLAMAIGDALTFLERVPPGRREVVVVSSRLDAGFDPTPLRRLPDDIGLELAPGPPAALDSTRMAFAPAGDDVRHWTTTVARDEHIVRAAFVDAGVVNPDAILTLSAPPDDRPAAERARRAALSAGARLTAAPPIEWRVVSREADAWPLDEVATPTAGPARFLARLAREAERAAVASACASAGARRAPGTPPEGLWPIAAWASGDPLLLGGERAGRPVVVSRADPGSVCGATLMAAAIEARSWPDAAPAAALAPWPADRRAEWSREAAEPGRDRFVHADADDARWFWGLVVVLLAVEGRWRRRVDDRTAQAPAASSEVSRVA
ncbi:MAG: BatA domain-containing protein [Acidobacteria bacterium]|nr:BatA domain-containing protein [Acidobacteriota bacterium]